MRRVWRAAILLAASAAGISACTAPANTQTGTAVIIAAGNIAGCSERDAMTASLAATIEGTVATLGDHAYEHGSAEDFASCYEPTWGELRDRTRPTPGNHDYMTGGAEGYYSYFGGAAGDPDRGYYAYSAGAWRVVALNSNCDQIGGCGNGSPQLEWLRQELAANPSDCTLAYWHHARFSSGAVVPGDAATEPFWDALEEAGAEVVLSAHSHHYERFAPQSGRGSADPERGIRQFVVGTGGREAHPLAEVPLANSEVAISPAYGVLEVTLREQGYAWRFVASPDGAVLDAGTDRCHESSFSLGGLLRTTGPYLLVVPIIVLAILALALRPPDWLVR